MQTKRYFLMPLAIVALGVNGSAAHAQNPPHDVAFNYATLQWSTGPGEQTLRVSKGDLVTVTLRGVNPNWNGTLIKGSLSYDHAANPPRKLMTTLPPYPTIDESKLTGLTSWSDFIRERGKVAEFSKYSSEYSVIIGEMAKGGRLSTLPNGIDPNSLDAWLTRYRDQKATPALGATVVTLREDVAKAGLARDATVGYAMDRLTEWASAMDAALPVAVEEFRLAVKALDALTTINLNITVERNLVLRPVSPAEPATELNPLKIVAIETSRNSFGVFYDGLYDERVVPVNAPGGGTTYRTESANTLRLGVAYLRMLPVGNRRESRLAASIGVGAGTQGSLRLLFGLSFLVGKESRNLITLGIAGGYVARMVGNPAAGGSLTHSVFKAAPFLAFSYRF